MNKNTILKTLGAIGFSPHEAKCYLCLLERNSLTVGEISKLAGIPRPNAYNIMEKLLLKGLCVSIPGKIKKYSMGDPKLLKFKILPDIESKIDTELEIEKKNMLEKLEEKQKDISKRKSDAIININNLVEALSPQFDRIRDDDNPLNNIEIYKDPLLAISRYNELMVNAKEELLTLEKPVGKWTPPPQEQYDNLMNSGSEEATKNIKKGLISRGIYELSDDIPRKKWQLILMEQFVKIGEEVRIIENAPMKMSSIDSKIVFFTMEDPLSGQPIYLCQIIRHKGIALAFKMMFEALWDQAIDYIIYKKQLKI